MYSKFMNSNKINVAYPPPKREIIKENVPLLLVKQKSVKDIVSIFEKDKVSPILPIADVYDQPLIGIALLKDKLQSISRYKIKNK